ncbi:hypothetical protein CHCC14821_0064 [Bacillus paralicheniformis]|nr:hypothetical protein CHCC14821_0064 [Bacillus paralicheniformis]
MSATMPTNERLKQRTTIQKIKKMKPYSSAGNAVPAARE